MAEKNCPEEVRSVFSPRPTVQTVVLMSLFLAFCTPVTKAQNGEQLFNQTCRACHTIGGGRLVGPDLINIQEKFSDDWLLRWTKSSQTLVRSGDSDAVAVFEEYNGLIMPDQNLTDTEISAIYSYIAGFDGSSAPALAPVTNASDFATPQEKERGKMIFMGMLPLANGGASCISCHNVTYKDVLPGGLLAKDLTTVYGRMGGDAGVAAIIKSPPFPAMTQTYKEHPLTEDEIDDLVAFFNMVNSDSENQFSTEGNPLLYMGLPMFAGILVLISLAYHKKKRYSVNKSIYDRQLRTV